MTEKVFQNLPPMTPALYSPTPSGGLKVKNELSGTSVKEEGDSVHISTCNHQKPKRTISSTIGDIKRGWVTLTQMSKGAVRGVSTGVISGSIIYTGYSALNLIKSNIAKITKKPAKLGKPVVGAAMGIAAFVVSLGYNLWTARLNTNIMTAQIDHKYNTGHDTV